MIPVDDERKGGVGFDGKCISTGEAGAGVSSRNSPRLAR